MKKKIFIITILSALLLLFTGCKSEPEPLRICLDMEYLGYIHEEKAETVFGRFMDYVKDVGGPQDFIIESIPSGGEERQAALTRLRTEIMAGEGPDLFIVECAGGISTNTGDPIFNLPEQALESGLFLSLDEYIENAQFMEWDKLMPEVMAAGRNKYGQQILPLTYTFPITCYRQSEVVHDASESLRWQDMLEDESKILTNAATWMHLSNEDLTNEDYGLFLLEQWEDDYLGYILGDLADYSQEELLFTEEELLQRTKEILELVGQCADGELSSVPDYYQEISNAAGYIWNMDDHSGIAENESLTMIPLYSDDGGITASVVSFAAISANTKRPEDAFFILDVLFSREVQQKSDTYKWLVWDNSMPTHMELMQEGYRCFQWNMTDENFNEFCEVRDQITNVEFRGGLDLELHAMFEKCFLVYTGRRSQSMEEIVHESYEKMKRMLGE